MKKTYTRPEIVFESFELSQSIAGGCKFISNQDPGACPVDFGGVYTLFADLDYCGTTPGPKDVLCYDVPADNKNIFES